MARPTFSGISGRVTELRAIDEEAVPASAPATSRLFVLPVAARRWVSTDNTPELDRLFKADAIVVPGSRPRLGLMFTRVCAFMLVHKFYLVECLRLEFEFNLNSK